MSLQYRMILSIIAIMMASLTLRIIYTSISPLQLETQNSLGTSFGEFGMLAALPQLCAGIFSFSLPFLLKKYNSEQIAAIGLGLMCVLISTPLVAGSLFRLYLLVSLVGVGIAITQPALQAVIKHHFPNHSMQMVALMILCMHFGSSLAAIETHNLATRFGDWHWSLFIFGMIICCSTFIWVASFKADIRPHKSAPPHQPTPSMKHLHFKKMTWLIVMYFVSSGIIYISLLAWLPNYFYSINSDKQHAANMLGVFVFNQAIAAFLLIMFARDHWNKRLLLLLAAGLTICGISIAIFAGPEWSLAFPLLCGLGLGVSFPVAMTLPHMYGNNPSETATLTMFALGVGSTLCAPFPFVIGWLKDISNNPDVLLWITLSSAVFMLVLIPVFKPVNNTAQ